MTIRTGLHNIHFSSQYHLPKGQDYTDADVTRFWAKVRMVGAEACWLWTASKMDRQGHGQFTCRRDGVQRHLYAHRVAWELTNGAIPAGQVICHACDVPECCNPAHLFLGTQADNLNDARRKGRLVDGLGARKLSDAAYRDILTTPRARGTGDALAAKYGVTKQTISRIRHGLQGSTYRRTQGHPVAAPVVFERVPSVQMPVFDLFHTSKTTQPVSAVLVDSVNQEIH